MVDDASPVAASDLDRHYELHLKHLKLKDVPQKTVEAYSRAIRRVNGLNGGGHWAAEWP